MIIMRTRHKFNQKGANSNHQDKNTRLLPLATKWTKFGFFLQYKVFGILDPKGTLDVFNRPYSRTLLWTFQPRQSGGPATCCQVMTHFSSLRGQRWSMELVQEFTEYKQRAWVEWFPRFPSVFQINLLSILEAFRWLEHYPSPKGGEATTENQAVIKALYSGGGISSR